MRFAPQFRPGSFSGQHLPGAAVCLLFAAAVSPLAAQPVVDFTGQRSSVAEKRSRPAPAAGVEVPLPDRSVDLPETREQLNSVRFVAPWRLTSGADLRHREAAEAASSSSLFGDPFGGHSGTPNLNDSGRGFSTVWDLGAWGRFALDLSDILQPLLIRDAVGAAASSAQLSYRTFAASAGGQEPMRLPAFPPWPLALVPLAATPLVGAVAIRLRRAIEPHLQARLTKRRRRRPGRRWQNELEGLGLGLGRGRRKHHRRRRHSRRTHRRIRFESGHDADEGSR